MRDHYDFDDAVIGKYAESDWIQTFSGTKFWPLEPRVEDVNIVDIAHALSNMCRFTGHCKEFYSVAQHSVLCAMVAPPSVKLWALLHDASEAYLHDLPRPLKRSGGFGDLYKRHESKLMAVICKAYELPLEEPLCVRDLDTRMLMTECRDLMEAQAAPWKDQVEPFEFRVSGWPPAVAKSAFLNSFVMLTTGGIAAKGNA